MRKTLPKRKDNTVNQRMQRHVQRVKAGGGKFLSMLMDGETNQSLQFLMSNQEITQRQFISELIQKSAKKAGFKYKDESK